jgi:hypothetical protein
MSKDLIRSIHTTAKNLGVCRADMHLPEYNEGQIVTCRDCEETGLLVDQEGRRMRYVEYEFKPEPQEP